LVFLCLDSLTDSARRAEPGALREQISNDHLRRLAITFLHGLESLWPSYKQLSTGSETILMLLPPLFQALVVHVAKAQTTRLNLIILEASRFHNSALDSEDHPSPHAFIVMSSLLNEVLEQLYDDAQDKTQQRPLIIVVDNPDDDTSEWVKQRAERVEDRIDVVLWNDLISTGLAVEEKALREEKPFLVSLPGQFCVRGRLPLRFHQAGAFFVPVCVTSRPHQVRRTRIVFVTSRHRETRLLRSRSPMR
jgi:hypothetical protein